MKKAQVGILMGSASDKSAMEEAAKALEDLGIGCEMRILSAHRTPDEVHEYVREAPDRGIRVLIAGAGMAAHLAGVVGASTNLPVIGVPMNSSTLGGLDALLSTVQMPPGIPVATMGIGGPGARNAGLFAARILALSDSALANRYRKFAEDQGKRVLSADKALQKERASRKTPAKRSARK
jgi:phosphoribosylaminoimidazole carboxylase PurE protein